MNLNEYNKMRIAYCMYGQPRNYEKGYEYVKKFIERNKDHTVDIFFHTWLLKEGEKYPCSPYRDIPAQELEYKENILEKLKSTYNPKDCCWNYPILDFSDVYLNTLIYQNTTDTKTKSNVNNILSQYYSKNRVRDLVSNYIEQTDIFYDVILLARFDFLNEMSIDINTIDRSKVYVTNITGPRYIISNASFICPQHIFLKWFDVFSNFKNIANNSFIENKVKSYGEKFIINGEELALINYLYHFGDLSNVVWTADIPNFI